MPPIAIIQARMSSRRFPGKVLAPFQGRPVLAHVVERLRSCQTAMPLILATSTHTSDDPLALYGASLGLVVVRGDLANVCGRFAQVLQQYPCEAFFRVCGDSPVLLPTLLDYAWDVYRRQHCDLVTNVFPRTFPVGMSVELLRSHTFLGLVPKMADLEDREHLTRYYYRHAAQFQIQNITCTRPADSNLRLAVDEVGDLAGIAAWIGASDRWECSEITDVKGI